MMEIKSEMQCVPKSDFRFLRLWESKKCHALITYWGVGDFYEAAVVEHVVAFVRLSLDFSARDSKDLYRAHNCGRAMKRENDNNPKTDQTTLRNSPSRRLVLKTPVVSLISILSCLPPSCGAEQRLACRDGKPCAPIEALLPAALTSTLANRPKLFVNGEKPIKRTNNLSAQITTAVSTANKEQWQKNRESFNVPTQLAAMWNQADVERQWGMLQASEAQREQSNEVRAALNYYTQQLQFGDSYRLTAPKETRKRMIRNDELPTSTAVITSDLDLRDLYRNQLLTSLDDAIAEANYQFKELEESQSVLDTGDLVDLMDQAFGASSKWFELIAKEDLQDAMAMVLRKDS
eukprot:scaffold22574_cov125-Cylindrotheca_fusiformis.AAC.21